MRRRFIYPLKGGDPVEVSLNSRNEPNYYIMPDIASYKSMIDGSEITSRSKHRAHLRAHGYQEIGNETSHLLKPPQGIPDVNPQGRKELIRAQIDAMSHAEFKRALTRDIERVKWNSRKE